VVDNLLEELRANGRPSESAARQTSREQLAVAVFKHAEGGERDFASLRRRVLNEIVTP
jgi:hypothetical protein